MAQDPQDQFPAAQTAVEEYHDIERQMAQPQVASDPDKIRKLGRRHAELGTIVAAYSTLFVAAPLYSLFRENEKPVRQRDARVLDGRARAQVSA